MGQSESRHPSQDFIDKMIEVTERQLAEKSTNSVKEALINSQVDYYLNETPFSLSIIMKKKFLKDFSNKSSTATTSTPSKSLNSYSESSMPTESGIDLMSKCNSCEEITKQLDETRKESIKNIRESKQMIKDLEVEDLNKDALIKQLKSEIKTTKEENIQIKKELEIRNGQLKEKNKSVEKLKVSIDKIKSDSETTQSNLINKIDNLEKVTKNLHDKLKTKEDVIKQERLKLKNKTKLKNNASQTQIENESSNKEIQTVSYEHKNMATSTEEKFFVIADHLKNHLLPHVSNIRNRCNSFPSCSTFSVKTSKVKTNILNPKEAPWVAIDPIDFPNVADSLNLTRDIAGFFCATASNMKREDLIVDMMEDIMKNVKVRFSTTEVEARVIKKARRKFALKDKTISPTSALAPD